jgi:hypothetical protein
MSSRISEVGLQRATSIIRRPSANGSLSRIHHGLPNQHFAMREQLRVESRSAGPKYPRHSSRCTSRRKERQETNPRFSRQPCLRQSQHRFRSPDARSRLSRFQRPLVSGSRCSGAVLHGPKHPTRGAGAGGRCFQSRPVRARFRQRFVCDPFAD